jgi:hypothetical protein
MLSLEHALKLGHAWSAISICSIMAYCSSVGIMDLSISSLITIVSNICKPFAIPNQYLTLIVVGSDLTFSVSNPKKWL